MCGGLTEYIEVINYIFKFTLKMLHIVFWRLSLQEVHGHQPSPVVLENQHLLSVLALQALP